MRLSLVLAALLCFTTWMNVVRATNGPVSSCCLRWSNTLQRVPLERILDYTIQSDGVCSITAVVFQTKRGLRICSDPNSDRAKEVILKVDEEKKKALQVDVQNEERSTSGNTPAVSTICSDPNSDRAKEVILKVDEEKKKALQVDVQNEEGSTSGNTPAVSTTSKKTPRKRGGAGRRRQRKRSRRGRKGQRKRL